MLQERPSLLGHIRRSRYLLVWIGLYVMFVLFQMQRFDFVDTLISSLANILPMMLLAAVVQYWLIPRFLRRHRLWIFYILSILILTAIELTSVHFDVRLFEAFVDRYPEQFIHRAGGAFSLRILMLMKYTFLLMATFIVTVISHLLREKAETDARNKEEHLQLELNYLKAQINPHFLFNSLNCIYSLALSESERTPESVLQLSEMLRYVIDDCQNDQVQLGKELHYIHNYIDFQKIRMESEPNITVESHVANPKVLIPPMILQPLVENCFKHSHIESDPNGFIAINIEQVGRHLTFVVENSVQPGRTPADDEHRTGIGVNNVRRRLEGLYGTRYTMQEFDNGATYKVEMQLNLEE